MKPIRQAKTVPTTAQTKKIRTTTPKSQKNTRKRTKKQKYPIELATKGINHVQDPKQRELINLTRVWYDKLESEGFKDIEPFTDLWGHLEYKGLIEGASNSVKDFDMASFEHFQLCRNYCTHNKSLKGRNRFIFEQYSEGLSFRRIIKLVKRLADDYPSRHKHWFYVSEGKRRIRLSLYTMHKIIKLLVADCYAWNRTDSEGLLRADRPIYIDGEIAKRI